MSDLGRYSRETCPANSESLAASTGGKESISDTSRQSKPVPGEGYWFMLLPVVDGTAV
jgi:hypothetical protein